VVGRKLACASQKLALPFGSATEEGILGTVVVMVTDASRLHFCGCECHDSKGAKRARRKPIYPAASAVLRQEAGNAAPVSQLFGRT
jgi:hypothetical protein